jgi:4-hydroxy-tetrahydrodipicolinate reductase
MRIAVTGAGGRMGSTVCAAVDGAEDMELVAAVDPGVVGSTLAATAGRPELTVSGDLQAIAAAAADVVVDFTVRDAARSNLAWYAAQPVHAVVGTTGLDDGDLAELSRSFPASGPAGCVVAPNFAIGAVLMMRFAELAAPWFETGEIIELHHDSKVDVPSGTAMLTARRMAAASPDWGDDPTRTELLAGARGGEGPAGIRVHAVRLRGLVAHQEVLLGTTGQSLTIRHDSYDRSSFMPGVLLAVRRVADRPGLTVGLDALLDL